MTQLANLSLKQQEVIGTIHAEDSIVLAVGAIRSGKTFAASLAFFIYSQSKMPDEIHLITGQNKNVLETEIIPHLQYFARVMGLPSNYKISRGELLIGRTKYLVVAGYDSSSEYRIRGLTVGCILSDELTMIPEDFFSQLVARMTRNGSKMYATTNPDSNRHWLKKNWIDEGKIRVIQMVFDDNPTLGELVKERNRALFSGVFFRRMVEGEWAEAEGLIYSRYTEIDEPNPKHMIRYDVGIDYGTSSTTAFVLLGTLNDSRGVVVKSLAYNAKEAERTMTDEELVDSLLRFTEGYNIRCVYVDPSASSFIASLRKRARGFAVRLADNKVVQGIRVTMNELAHGKVLIVRGKNEALLDEFASYSWDSKEVDKPIKENDHLSDALRYVIYSTRRRRYTGPVSLPRGL